jgi:hypothetical protein
MLKKCSKCNANDRLNNKRSWCSQCESEYRKQKKSQDPGWNKRNLERQKKYQLANKEKFKQRQVKMKESLKGRYGTYRLHASERGLTFLLTLEEFDTITSRKCYYCNEFTKNKTFVGIDRVKNDEGYTLTNCVSCCKMCNLMKHTNEQREWIEHIEKILNNLKSKENINA